jgi:hypothetical protein
MISQKIASLEDRLARLDRSNLTNKKSSFRDKTSSSFTPPDIYNICHIDFDFLKKELEKTYSDYDLTLSKLESNFPGHYDVLFFLEYGKHEFLQVLISLRVGKGDEKITVGVDLKFEHDDPDAQFSESTAKDYKLKDIDSTINHKIIKYVKETYTDSLNLLNFKIELAEEYHPKY